MKSRAKKINIRISVDDKINIKNCVSKNFILFQLIIIHKKTNIEVNKISKRLKLS